MSPVLGNLPTLADEAGYLKPEVKMQHLNAKAKLLQRSKVKMAARRVHTAPGGGRAVEGVEVESAPRILPYSCNLIQFPWAR